MLLHDVIFYASSFGLSQTAVVSPRDPPPYYGAAEVAYTQLQTWYVQDAGLWDTTNWWNAANCITVIANLLSVDGNIKTDGDAVLSNTFTAAQSTPSELRNQRTMVLDWSKPPLQQRAPPPGNAGFLNYYYDDEAWWSLAWIQAYDYSKNGDWLAMAKSIYDDITSGDTGNCSFSGATGGGVWWNKGHEQINSIGNGLYMSIAAHLANRESSDDKQGYIDAATTTWTWMKAAGLQNSSSMLTDGLILTDCSANNYDGWSYNQGVIIGALVELSQATGDTSYMDSARAVADSYIQIRTDATSGIARDNCEPDGCSGDQTQFKGVFMRNLAKLWSATNEDSYKNFIIANADSIIAHDTSDGKLGLVYSGPYQAGDASTQSSAMDALVAAIVVSA